MINAYIFRLHPVVRPKHRALRALDERYNHEWMMGEAYVHTYMDQLGRWWNQWTRVHDMLIERINTTVPLDWPASQGNLEPGSWIDTPCDYFRDIPCLPSSSGRSLNDIDWRIIYLNLVKCLYYTVTLKLKDFSVKPSCLLEYRLSNPQSQHHWLFKQTMHI